MVTHLYKTPSEVKAEIRDYYDRSPFGKRESDCFMPWYFQHVCLYGETASRRQSSDGSDDFGIDGFHLEINENETTLYIIQAKDSGDKFLVQSGVKEFWQRSIPKLSELISGNLSVTNNNENQVIKNLRSALVRLSIKQKNKLGVQFFNIHRVDLSAEELRAFCIDEINQLKDHFYVTFNSFTFLGCTFLDFQKQQGQTLDDWITVEGNYLKQSNQERKIFFGVASLSDLIKLYNDTGDDIFEENVRYFIASKRNLKDEGPAGNMWVTLKDICISKNGVSKRNADDFTVFHNGLSICCSLIETNGSQIKLIKPRIVNGCQTIKGIYLRWHDEKEKKVIEKFDMEIWNSIRIPVRIIETSKQEIIYEVAINNNRQNGNDSTALRSNDEFQRKLKDKLKNKGVFYERQKEEYKNLSKNSNIDLENEYPNTSTNAPIKMQELGQALAAVLGKINDAANPSTIFENGETYKKIFRERSYPLSFIIGLYNLSTAMGPALNLAKNNIEKYSDLNVKTLKWSILYLTMRYICVEEREFFTEISQNTLRPYDIKDGVLKLLKRSGILRIIHEVYLRDETDSSTRDALRKAEGKITRKQVDIFEGWDEEQIRV